MKLEVHNRCNSGRARFLEKIPVLPKWSKNGSFRLYFKFSSLLLAENVLKCAPYCRKSGKKVHMSRKILVLVFLGLEALGQSDHSNLQMVIIVLVVVLAGVPLCMIL